MDEASETFERPERAELPLVGFFQLLDHSDRDLLTRTSTIHRFERGQTVVEEGQYLDLLYAVVDGQLRVDVPDRHGLPLEVARFGPGDYIGEMSFLRGERASATVRAATDARLLAIPHEALGEVSDRNPGVMREIAGVVARRLSATNQRFRDLRPGRSMGCVSADTPASAAFIFAVCRSAAEHLRRPVLLVDLAHRERAEATHTFGSIEAALAHPGLLAEHDRFSTLQEAAVGVLTRDTGDPLDGGAVLELLSSYQSRYGLVLVSFDAHSLVDESLFPGLEGPLVIREAGGPAGDWPDSLPGSTETILLNVTPGVRQSEAASLAIRTVTATVATLRSLTANTEPGASVGWVARHILRRKVGLALGAGGAKGYAHLGVIEGLSELGVSVDFIAGSSIGAPIAAALAATMSTGELRSLLDETFARALRFTLPFYSFLSGTALRRDLERIAKGATFEQLALPLAIVAVDLAQRSEVVFRHGDVARAMAASMAIPGIFPPVRWQGRQLVDGGLLNPIPSATVAAMGADVVIGVKLTNPAGTAQPTSRRRSFALRAPPIVDTIQAAFEVMQWKIIEDGSARADITIEPKFRGATGLRDFGRADEFIAAGRDAVAASQAEIRALLPWAK